MLAVIMDLSLLRAAYEISCRAVKKNWRLRGKKKKKVPHGGVSEGEIEKEEEEEGVEGGALGEW